MIAALVMLGMTSCKEKDSVQHMIVGEWLYQGEESGHEIEVYVAFNVDFTFDLYQKIGDGIHRYFKGTYNVDRELVTGMYNDRTPWSTDYEVSFHEGDMVMKSVSDKDYSITYKKKRIPAEVRMQCVDMTKSATETFIPFL